MAKPKRPSRRVVSTASIVVSAAVVLGLVLSFRVPWVGYGIVAALVSVVVPAYLAVVLFRGPQRQTLGAQRATIVLLVAFPIGAVAIAYVRFGTETALVTAGAAIALLYAMVFRAYVGSLAKVRAVAALRRALAADDKVAIEAAVARAKTWRTPVAFQAIAALAEHAHVTEAESVARALPATAALQLDRAAWLVGFALARTDVTAARAVIDALDREALPPAHTTVVELLDARIRIAEGKAADVARELAGPAPDGLAPPLVDMRDLVRADAKAVLKDKQGAASLVREVVARKRQSLGALAKTNRPLAPIAADLLRKAS